MLIIFSIACLRHMRCTAYKLSAWFIWMIHRIRNIRLIIYVMYDTISNKIYKYVVFRSLCMLSPACGMPYTLSCCWAFYWLEDLIIMLSTYKLVHDDVWAWTGHVKTIPRPYGHFASHFWIYSVGCHLQKLLVTDGAAPGWLESIRFAWHWFKLIWFGPIVVDVGDPFLNLHTYIHAHIHTYVHTCVHI